MAKNITARQWRLSVVVDITADNAADVKIPLPPGAMVLSGTYNVLTAAAGTSPTLTMVDDLGSPNTYLNAVAIGAAAKGGIAAGVVGTYYPSGSTLSFSVGGTSPTGGRVLVNVDYIKLNRQNEHFGQDPAM